MVGALRPGPPCRLDRSKLSTNCTFSNPSRALGKSSASGPTACPDRRAAMALAASGYRLPKPSCNPSVWPATIRAARAVSALGQPSAAAGANRRAAEAHRGLTALFGALARVLLAAGGGTALKADFLAPDDRVGVAFSFSILET